MLIELDLYKFTKTTVFPAPLSPLTKIDWLPCSLIIDLRYRQLQKDGDLALQRQLLYTAASYGHHTNAAISGKDSQLLRYFQYTSAKNRANRDARLDKTPGSWR